MNDSFPPDHIDPGPEVAHHSQDSERAVLGSLLQHNDSWDRIGDLLSDQDFYAPEHRAIFSAIGSLINAARPADTITVYEQLERDGKAEAVGGLVYLNQLAQAVPSAAAIRRYAEIVRERAILRRLQAAGQEIQAVAFSPSGKNVKELLDMCEQKVLAIGEDTGRMQQGFVSMDNIVVQVIDRIQELADNPKLVTGVPTGFHDLDNMTTGMQAGDLIVIAGRPSMGKTAFAINIAEHVAINEGLPVAVFSMEMGAYQLGIRIIGSIGRINQQHLRTGQLTDEEWPRFTEAVEKMRSAQLHIEETGGLSPGEMRAKARRLRRQCGGKLGLIVVDYLQLMATAGEENRATELGEITRGLKNMGKEMGCPVIALSQLSRAVEQRGDKRPMMSDLRESGAIEQDADVIMFLYRDEYYNKDSKEPGVAEVIMSKQRSGPTGTIKMAFVKELTKFESLASGDF
jgi:replicative DNA helicase